MGKLFLSKNRENYSKNKQRKEKGKEIARK
jgi:hypothetical protein